MNYIDRKSPNPPKALVKALNRLKKRDDIVITKPDKGSGVVIMDRDEYTRLLQEASVDDTSKFVPIDDKRPKQRGRPPKHFHPLLQKEKEIHTVVHQILPKPIAVSVSPNGSRLAHLYGLPKTHKEKLSMRPILSASGTYNYHIAKWLEEKLSPLSVNEYTINDTFGFSDEIRKFSIKENDILVSYDVTSLFTNVPLKETINILVNKAFVNDWFNNTYNLKLKKDQLVKLLEIATTNQLFQLNGQLYEQVDGVAMGSPLGPLMANIFMCSLEDKLTEQNMVPSLYRRYVDDTLVIMPDVETAGNFLSTLNGLHSSIGFTMELSVNDKISFIGMEIIKKECNQDHYERWMSFKERNALRQLDFGLNCVRIESEEISAASSKELEKASAEATTNSKTFKIDIPKVHEDFPSLGQKKTKIYPLPISHENQCTILGVASNLDLFSEEFGFPCKKEKMYLPMKKSGKEIDLDKAYERYAFLKAYEQHKEEQKEYERILRRQEIDCEETLSDERDNDEPAILPESDSDSEADT
ncbi:hypothetical protein QZH41_006282 [Actinostola sp. cb2023]|nr:hypothetical protein QZH41_006282 [Actinostola sp. cb2023]